MAVSPVILQATSKHTASVRNFNLKQTHNLIDVMYDDQFARIFTNIFFWFRLKIYKNIFESSFKMYYKNDFHDGFYISSLYFSMDWETQVTEICV